MKNFLQEFKQFAMRGNVMDLAIGVIIGAAFGKIVSSMVNDVVMPLIGQLIGKVDFSNFYLNLSGAEYPSLAAAKAAGAATINYGLFLNNVIDFLIVALVIFIVIKQINRFQKKEAAPEPNTKECPFCKSAIAKAATKCAFCTSAV